MRLGRGHLNLRPLERKLSKRKGIRGKCPKKRDAWFKRKGDLKLCELGGVYTTLSDTSVEYISRL